MELDGTLTQIAAIPQPNFFMVHDMLLGSEHLVFVVPPVHYDLEALWSGRAAPADSLRYMASEQTRLIVVRKDGTGSPISIEQPACIVFHHGNLAEAGDSITLDSLMSPDDSILRYISEWSAEKPTRPRPTQLTRLSLDLGQRHVTGRSVLGEALEYPRFDSRMSGKAARHLYTLADEEDYAMRALVRHDFANGTTHRVDAGQGHALEEAVFVPRPGKTAEGEGGCSIKDTAQTAMKLISTFETRAPSISLPESGQDNTFPLGSTAISTSRPNVVQRALPMFTRRLTPRKLSGAVRCALCTLQILHGQQPDARPRASMEAFEIPSHGAQLNAFVYVAAGAGPHPAIVLLHGFPFNERGIGAHLVTALRGRGYRVVANSRNISSTHSFESLSDVLLIDGDIGRYETAAAVAQAAVAEFGSIDVLVNNAGIFELKLSPSITAEDFCSFISTHLAGFFYISQLAVRQMLVILGDFSR